MQTLQRRQFTEFLPRHPIDGAGRRAGGGCVDDHHPPRAAHLEGHVHPGGAAVDQTGAGRHAAIPQVANQNRTDAIVTAQQVPAADHEDLVRRRFEIDVGIRCARGHTMPLMTNFDSSLPVFPS